jgi:hypothetical protein
MVIINQARLTAGAIRSNKEQEVPACASMSSILFHDASITYFTAEMAFVVALSSGLSDIFSSSKETKKNDLSYYGINFSQSL